MMRIKISGPQGCGKSAIAQMIYDYCMTVTKQGIVLRDEGKKIIHIGVNTGIAFEIITKQTGDSTHGS